MMRKQVIIPDYAGYRGRYVKVNRPDTGWMECSVQCQGQSWIYRCSGGSTGVENIRQV